MRARNCPSEHDVLTAARRGALDDAMRLHAKTCATCAETIAVVAALATLGEDDEAPRARVDARVLWLKAQLAPRAMNPAEAEKAAQGVTAVWVAVTASWVVLLVWRWADLRQLLETMTPGRLLKGVVETGTLPVASLAVVVIMAAVTLAIMLHQVFVEEF